MIQPIDCQTDLIDELRLRRWAREHYVPAGRRDVSWDPVVLEEMRLRDAELLTEERPYSRTESLVPLPPASIPRLDPVHVAVAPPKMLEAAERAEYFYT